MFDLLAVLQISCKSVVAFFQFSILANYFWLLVEGMYLQTLLALTFVSQTKYFWWYILIGWGGWLTASFCSVCVSLSLSLSLPRNISKYLDFPLSFTLSLVYIFFSISLPLYLGFFILVLISIETEDSLTLFSSLIHFFK